MTWTVQAGAYSPRPMSVTVLVRFAVLLAPVVLALGAWAAAWYFLSTESDLLAK